jgi:hypothetical protein
MSDRKIGRIKETRKRRKKKNLGRDTGLRTTCWALMRKEWHTERRQVDDVCWYGK